MRLIFIDPCVLADRKTPRFGFSKYLHFSSVLSWEIGYIKLVDDHYPLIKFGIIVRILTLIQLLFLSQEAQ